MYFSGDVKLAALMDEVSRERAAVVRSLFLSASARLSSVFVSELRASREAVIRRLTQPA